MWGGVGGGGEEGRGGRDAACPVGMGGWGAACPVGMGGWGAACPVGTGRRGRHLEQAHSVREADAGLGEAEAVEADALPLRGEPVVLVDCVPPARGGQFTRARARVRAANEAKRGAARPFVRRLGRAHRYGSPFPSRLFSHLRVHRPPGQPQSPRQRRRRGRSAQLSLPAHTRRSGGAARARLVRGEGRGVST